MHRTLCVESLGVSYCWLMLVENINSYVCDVQKKYVAIILLRAYRAARNNCEYG